MEPEGVMRALLQLWEDPAGKATKPEWLVRVDARRKNPIGVWRDTIIQTLFELVRTKYASDPVAIQALPNLAYQLYEVPSASHAHVGDVDALEPHPDAITILTELAKDPGFIDYAKVVLLQIWIKLGDASKRADLLTELGSWTVSDMETHVDTNYLDEAQLKAMLGKTKTPTDGQLCLAFIDRFTTPHKASEEFLLHYLGDADTFPAADIARIEATLGTRGVEGVLASLGRGQFADGGGGSGKKKGPRTEPGNLDLDEDEQNESYAEPVQRPGKVVNCYVLRVRKRPSMDAKTLDYLHAGDEVFVIGHKDGWDVIDWHGKTAFVGSHYIER
jgi:hypothetical protein